jgi:large subunit ribosomal protein L21
MYAVIKTGGKQYRVQAGDLLVVEKLDGEPGAKLAFDQVLMIGEGEAVTVGAPLIEGASVSATLVETRKGEKIKVFKKIRRQGYRRTRGHRQLQSVLRVTGIDGDGKSIAWEGAVDLTPLAVLNARARNLARGMDIAEARKAERLAAKSVPAEPKAAKPVAAKKVATKESEEAPAPATVKKSAAAKPATAKVAAPKAAAPKTAAKTPAKPKAVKAKASDDKA